MNINAKKSDYLYLNELEAHCEPECDEPEELEPRMMNDE